MKGDGRMSISVTDRSSGLRIVEIDHLSVFRLENEEKQREAVLNAVPEGSTGRTTFLPFADMSRLTMTEELKPCPFCGRAVDIENPDAAYPLTPSNVVPEIWQAGCIESEGR